MDNEQPCCSKTLIQQASEEGAMRKFGHVKADRHNCEEVNGASMTIEETTITTTTKKKTLKLQGNDGGEPIEIDLNVARVSDMISDMLDNCANDDDDEEQDSDVITIPEVNEFILRKVVQWAKHHKDDPPVDDEDQEEEAKRFRIQNNLSEWDTRFLDVDLATLMQIIKAADYLSIKGLMNLACKGVAMIINDKSTEEIRATFGIECDLSEQDLAQIEAENEWCEET